jgi:hypothetical protein
MSVVAARFDRWSLSWKQCLNLISAPRGEGWGSRFRHDSRKMLHVIRLASKLRGGASSLAEIVAKSLAAVLPNFLQQSFLDDALDLRIDVKAALPSPAISRRYEIALDIALMLLQRNSVQSSASSGSSFVRMGLADSSPMAGFDWLWSEYYELDKRNVVSTFEAVVSLTGAIEAFAREQEQLGEELSGAGCRRLVSDFRLAQVAGERGLA